MLICWYVKILTIFIHFKCLCGICELAKPLLIVFQPFSNLFVNFYSNFCCQVWYNWVKCNYQMSVNIWYEINYNFFWNLFYLLYGYFLLLFWISQQDSLCPDCFYSTCSSATIQQRTFPTTLNTFVNTLNSIVIKAV